MDDNLNVVIYKYNKKTIGFNISGHANFDVHGKDIVCAGVSVIAQTTLASLDKLTDIKNYKYKIDEGHTYIIINPSDIDKNVELLLNTFIIGVEGIRNSYKQYINIEEQEVDLNDECI